MGSLLLNALQKKNRDRPPVWLMRQAGRYLPEYQLLRSRYSLRELFFTPELAAQITLMPVERFGVDAAILFSDITAIAPALGLKLWFDEGPLVEPWVEPDSVLQCNLEMVNPIFETIRLIKQRSAVPLIGFCGGPFTVASYLIERHNGVDFPKTLNWMRRDPDQFASLIEKIRSLSILYLKRQIEAGADAIQIFDSWANVLQEREFSRFCLEPIETIVRSVNKPVIVFMRGSAKRALEIEKTGAAAISVDWEVPIDKIRAQVSCSLQGNLDPDLLFSDPAVVKQQTHALLEQMRGDPGFIVNLGHGVKIGTPIESVRAFIDAVKEYQP